MIKTRNTSQKQLILEAISHLEHPTCEEIYAEVLKQDDSIGRATVFRNVKTLTDNKQLVKIVVPKGALRYDMSLKKHSHFICDRCGKVLDIFYLPNIDIPKSNLYEIDGYSLIFTGLCKECKKKER